MIAVVVNRQAARQTNASAFSKGGILFTGSPHMNSKLAALALLFALIFAGQANAVQPGPDAAVAVSKAATLLQAHVDSLRAKGRRPDYAAGPAADLFQRVFDLEALAALPGPTSHDLPWLLEWSEAANRSYKQMYLFGVPPGREPDEASLALSVQAHQDQIVVALNFLMRLMARELDVSQLFMADLPKAERTAVRLAGFNGFRSLSGQFLYNALCATQSVTPRNAMVILTAIDDTRTTWIRDLSPENKKSAVAMLTTISHVGSDTQVTSAANTLRENFVAQPDLAN